MHNEVLTSTSDDDLTSVEMSCSEAETESSNDGLPDFPAFSPEALISWMFERCFRRREEGVHEMTAMSWKLGGGSTERSFTKPYIAEALWKSLTCVSTNNTSC